MYRIITGKAYNGCIPITVYWVQKRVSGIFNDRWINIKGYEDKNKALKLLDFLKGE